ncbi:MAG: right-handed parallel beta-helix repeat-containing protein, partial [Promethearchaeota archaeon]
NGRMDAGFYQGEGTGINITNSNQINISYSYFSNNFFAGIGLKNVNNSNFYSNNLTYNNAIGEMPTGYGLFSMNSELNTFNENNASMNWLRGIFAIGIKNWQFDSNLIFENGLSRSYDSYGGSDGVLIQESSYISLFNNNFSKNYEDGIDLEYSNHSVIMKNFAGENGNSGIYTNHGKNESISYNKLDLNNAGIECRYGIDAKIFYNNITNSSLSGISVSFTDEIKVQFNIIENCDQGFNLQWCDYSNFSLNTLYHCGGLQDWKSPFYMSSSNNNTFNWNIVNITGGFDFYISNSKSNLIYGNFLNNISLDFNQDFNSWNNTDYGNYWKNYTVLYPEAIAINGIYNIPYNQIYNTTRTFGNASDYLPLTYEYWQQIYNEKMDPPELLILQAPILQTLNSTDNDGIINLNWNSVENAEGYNIYNSSTYISDISEIQALENVSSTNYIISGLNNGTYYFVVSAYNKTVESNASNCVWTEVRILPQNFAPQKPIVDPINSTDDDGNFRLTWQAVEGAVNYSIFYSMSNPNSAQTTNNLVKPISSIEGMDLLATVETTFYDVKGLGNGTYYFVIIANNESGSSDPSEVIAVTVQIPPEEGKNPFFTPVIVLGSFIGASLGAVASNFIPTEKVVDLLKETKEKLRKKNKKTKSDMKADNKGDSGSKSSNDINEDKKLGDLKTTEQQVSLEASIPVPTDINWQRYLAILEKLWNYLPRDLRDMLLRVVDKYLKFRDEAELIILNSFYTLSLSYLSTFESYRAGDKNKSISTLDKITKEAQKEDFENLSEEAKITKEEFIIPNDAEKNTKEV